METRIAASFLGGGGWRAEQAKAGEERNAGGRGNGKECNFFRNDKRHDEDENEFGISKK
jgi:hypothetical protein